MEEDDENAYQNALVPVLEPRVLFPLYCKITMSGPEDVDTFNTISRFETFTEDRLRLENVATYFRDDPELSFETDITPDGVEVEVELKKPAK